MKNDSINMSGFLQNPALLHLEKLTGIAPADVPMDDPKVYSLLTSPDALGVTVDETQYETGALGIPVLETTFMRSIMREDGAESFDDLIKVSELTRGGGAWGKNPDVFAYLLEKGIEQEQVFTFVTQLQEGIGFDSADEKLLREHCIPDWYIVMCNKVSHLSPIAPAISRLDVPVRLLWFKLYYPLAFYSTAFQEADYSILKCRERLLIKMRIAERTERDQVEIEEMRLMNAMFRRAQLKSEYLRRGYAFLPPEPGKSCAEVYKIEDGKLRLPYITIDGIGPYYARRLEEKAEPKESYASLEEFRRKTGLSILAVDALDEAGLLSGVGEKRAE